MPDEGGRRTRKGEREILADGEPARKVMMFKDEHEHKHEQKKSRRKEMRKKKTPEDWEIFQV